MGAKSTFEDLKRLNGFSADPEDLVIVDDPNDPLYDPRVEMALKPEFVENIRKHGIGLPVLIRKNQDGKPEVVDGRQRVKAARWLNLNGADPKIMVPCSVRRGDSADAIGMSVSLNAHRQEDPRRARIAHAQRLARFGHSDEDIANFMGVSVATAKRLQAANTKPAPKKVRGKSNRPSVKDIQAMREDPRLSGEQVEILDWVLGKSDSATLCPLERIALRG